MERAWKKIGLLMAVLGLGAAVDGPARAQTCAPNEKLCAGGACCAAGLCCPTTVTGCCDEGAPYCCGDGTCAVTPSACAGASSGTNVGCAGYDLPCGAGCIPAGADCCDGNHYCPPTTVCASPSVTMCTNRTSEPVTEAYLVTLPEPLSPLDAPANATSRSCALSEGPSAPRGPMGAVAAMSAFALVRWRRRATRAST
jgi:hypothetical protein